MEPQQGVGLLQKQLGHHIQHAQAAPASASVSARTHRVDPGKQDPGPSRLELLADPPHLANGGYSRKWVFIHILVILGWAAAGIALALFLAKALEPRQKDDVSMAALEKLVQSHALADDVDDGSGSTRLVTDFLAQVGFSEHLAPNKHSCFKAVLQFQESMSLSDSLRLAPNESPASSSGVSRFQRPAPVPMESPASSGSEEAPAPPTPMCGGVSRESSKSAPARASSPTSDMTQGKTKGLPSALKTWRHTGTKSESKREATPRELVCTQTSDPKGPECIVCTDCTGREVGRFPLPSGQELDAGWLLGQLEERSGTRNYRLVDSSGNTMEVAEKRVHWSTRVEAFDASPASPPQEASEEPGSSSITPQEASEEPASTSTPETSEGTARQPMWMRDRSGTSK